jgi:hypothetical protein
MVECETLLVLQEGPLIKHETATLQLQKHTKMNFKLIPRGATSQNRDCLMTVWNICTTVEERARVRFTMPWHLSPRRQAARRCSSSGYSPESRANISACETSSTDQSGGRGCCSLPAPSLYLALAGDLFLTWRQRGTQEVRALLIQLFYQH